MGTLQHRYLANRYLLGTLQHRYLAYRYLLGTLHIFVFVWYSAASRCLTYLYVLGTLQHSSLWHKCNGGGGRGGGERVGVGGLHSGLVGRSENLETAFTESAWTVVSDVLAFAVHCTYSCLVTAA